MFGDKQYILSTPGIKGDLFNQNSRFLDEPPCQYCEMKKKLNLGTNGEHKCFQHSVKKDFQAHQTNDKSYQLSDNESKLLTGEEMLELLETVSQGLDQYWENLHEICGGNSMAVQKDLEPVLTSVRNIQEKLSKFMIDSNPLDISDIKKASESSPLRKYHCSGSQKVVRESIIPNVFDMDTQATTDCIKEWVMHFYKVLQTRQIDDSEEMELPYQNQLEMRIFKQSLERKYLTFAQDVQKNQVKLQEVLNKLIYYMEKSNNVSPHQIQADINFIEGEQLPQSRESTLTRVLLLQACSVQHFLNIQYDD